MCVLPSTSLPQSHHRTLKHSDTWPALCFPVSTWYKRGKLFARVTGGHVEAWRGEVSCPQAHSGQERACHQAWISTQPAVVFLRAALSGGSLLGCLWPRRKGALPGPGGCQVGQGRGAWPAACFSLLRRPTSPHGAQLGVERTIRTFLSFASSLVVLRPFQQARRAQR